MKRLSIVSTRLFLFGFIAVALTLSGCDLVDSDPPDRPTISTADVFVSNQGNFADANGTVTAFNVESGQSETAISPSAVIQSVEVLEDQLFVMAGDRVDIYDIESLSRVGEIDGVTNARYILFGGQDLALITNIAQFDSEGNVTAPPSVSLVDLQENEVISSLELDGSPSGIALASNLIFVAKGGFGVSNEVAAISIDLDAGELELEDNIDVGCAPTFLFSLGTDRISGLCNTEEGEGQYIIITPAEMGVSVRQDLGGTVQTASGAGQKGYFSSSANVVLAVVDQERIVVMEAGTGNVEDELGPFDGNPIGGVAYDEVERLIYLARPVGDFQTTGEVTVHSTDGEEVGRFDAGISPSHIVFSRVFD